MALRTLVLSERLISRLMMPRVFDIDMCLQGYPPLHLRGQSPRFSTTLSGAVLFVLDINLSPEIHVIAEVMAHATVPVDEVVGVVRGHVAVQAGEHLLHPSVDQARFAELVRAVDGEGDHEEKHEHGCRLPTPTSGA